MPANLVMMEDWQRIVEFVRSTVASDVYLNRSSVKGRVDGKVVRLSSPDDFTEDAFERLVRALVQTRPDLLPALETAMPSLDFSTEMYGMRFRVNIVRAQGKLSASLRPLSENPPTPESVGLPEKVTTSIANAVGGLVLITGATGSGKTTTLAAILETINQTRPVKIVTIEDPIEFIFHEKLADIAQREVGFDCPSFHVGARDAWRQNPDVISIAEIRDHETAVVAIQAAETGHLVFGTLHANSVAEMPERFLKLLPAEMRERARDVLAAVLVALLSQVLIPKREGGRIALREILLNDDAITAVLKKGSDHELEHYMRSGRARGMTNRKTHLQSIRGQIESLEYNRWMQLLN
ncbi:MAG: Flp pilus assembly complex ATPase component TadA [Verrucomicrobia bacterium]|nr:Flp pilus assembly complex ATPase component TadA [Verrucomicrobiota bacterium]